MTGDPRAAVEALAACEAVHLVGVRHHSPALAAAMPSLLEAAAPEVLAIELPAEARGWLHWLTEPDAIAPLALAFDGPRGLAFYPFADFSPELAALRWARSARVPVACIDLPLADAGSSESEAREAQPRWRRALAARARAEEFDGDETWDRLVEAPAPGSTPEAVRRAALAHGWAGREAVGEIDGHTLRREAWMRACLAALGGRRAVAVVGAFHAPVLSGAGSDPFAAGDLRGWAPLDWEDPVGDDDRAGCLVPYTFAQLDSRSGYPAGIRDPEWQQAVVEADGDPAAIRSAATRMVTRVVRELRRGGHPAGPAEAAETVRVALDLAALRGLAAPSRREILEAVSSVLGQGALSGRSRALAGALETVLVGARAGRVATGTPRSPLRETLQAELRAARLPAEGRHAVSLAPLREPDLTKHVLLRRLEVGGIAYGERESVARTRGAEAVLERWQVAWTAATDASIELSAVKGLTAEQLATTSLLTRPLDDVDAHARLLADAADCGLPDVAAHALDAARALPATCGFGDAVRLGVLLDDVARARLPGATLLADDLRARAGELEGEFTSAALRELQGIRGSDDEADAVALGSFVAMAGHLELGLEHALREVLEDGSPLMQGGAAGLVGALGARVASWLDLPEHRVLRRRLVGLLLVAGWELDSSPAMVALVERVAEIDDEEFVRVLPSLRGGFEVLGAARRRALLTELGHRYGQSAGALVLPPEETLAVVAHDRSARERLAALGLGPAQGAVAPVVGTAVAEGASSEGVRVYPVPERWRLILAQERESLSPAGERLGNCLDGLYGRPETDALDGSGRGAGDGPAALGVREWAAEIEAVFGQAALQEILGEAAAAGRGEVLELLDPARVRPSVDLLTTALLLAGSLSEARLARLRPLVRRLVAQLAEQLAVRLRPALTGLASARPTRRAVGPLDLAATIRRNLRHVVLLDGRPQVVPAAPVFRQPQAKASDWHLIVVVDVSGSMSSSVVFSALTAAVLTGVPQLDVTFLAFNTQVMDLTGHVDDPLSLLLEVSIGGGTDIAGAMHVARSRVRVPSRTLCVLVSDFEEYAAVGELLGEVDAMHAAGVHLMGCAALDDSGDGAYNVGVAQQLAGVGMRVAAVTPLDLARWVGRVIRGEH
ncbi:DUF5682 family protein [Tessaracoccus oleiagri]|uniref:VWA domain containing CoxE-like protein n=1 Tax=Tessaracoccus oleiagri TaxID=686624 RepID=A0A1G9N6L2_9ACTN|nr:DUF5682 family protein [Tessaracoccus oleiagri]SDL82118.1 VWA domain containing CoxE-like protein [Tessaracoccus oleiagri]